MRKSSLFSLSLVLLAASCSDSDDDFQAGIFMRWVDPMIGTGAHYSEAAAELLGAPRKAKPLPTSKRGDMAGYDQAHDPGQLIPAVLAPHGMNFWTPQTEDTEQKGISPYYYADEEIQGFRASHWIVGGATQDYGSFTLMPVFGSLVTDPIARGSRFSHDREVSTPAYYSVELEDYDITAEMTGTSRTALFRFTFHEAGDAWIVANPNSDEGFGSMTADAQSATLTGCNPVHRIYQGKGLYAGFDGHFIVTAEKPCLDAGICNASDSTDVHRDSNVNSTTGNNVSAYLHFKVKRGESILVKAATSFTSLDGARLNLATESHDWDFDAMRHRLTDTWEQALGRIEVEARTDDGSVDTVAMTNFYTALYHASFLPREMNDVDGSRPRFGISCPSVAPILPTSMSREDAIVRPSLTTAFSATVPDASSSSLATVPDGSPSGPRPYYDDYSLWDTYRALHPLIVLLDPERAGDMVQSVLNKYDDGGWLPIFPCWNSYTSEMIGDHAISLIADAYVKGVRNFDIEKAYRAAYRNAFVLPIRYADYAEGKGRRALIDYIKYGFVPVEEPVIEAYHKAEQTSRTLEYAYDDYLLAQLALLLSRDESRTPQECDDLRQTAEVLLQRAQSYRNVFNPALGWVDGRHRDGSWVNGDPWQFQPYITEGRPCHYTWYVPHDVPGLIGLMGGNEEFTTRLDSLFDTGYYWHGNEPCHQIAYLYNYAGQPRKTQQRVRSILQHEYAPTPDGLAGNDDAGQMSAWYIFSALGFYPVCPGTTGYAIGSPTFAHTTLHLPSGLDFEIIAHGASPSAIHVDSLKLNGQPHGFFLSHDEITSGATLEAWMSNSLD